MTPTRQAQVPYPNRREFNSHRRPHSQVRDQSIKQIEVTAAEHDDTYHFLFRNLRWLKKKVEKILMWKRIEPFFPELPAVSTVNPTADYIVGLTLHCFILSSFVLSIATVRIILSFLRFVCYVTLQYAIYRGDITPIMEDSADPVTFDQLREATILNSSGLKIILVHRRSQLQCTDSVTPARVPDVIFEDDRSPGHIGNSRTTTITSRPRNSGSDSSQDASNIFSFSST